jgi:hypothetical protein
MPRNVEPALEVLPYVVVGVYVGVKGRNGAGAEYVFGALFIIIKINILKFYYKFIFLFFLEIFYLKVNRYKNWFTFANISSRILYKSLFDMDFNAELLSNPTK